MPSLYEPFPYGIQQSRETWDDLIKRYGDLAILRRPGLPDRWVSMMVAQFTPAERLGMGQNPVDRKVLISALTPDTGLPLNPEPCEKDMLVTLVLSDDGSGSPVTSTAGVPQEDEHLKLFASPGRAGPSRLELYWRFAVRA
jgi:hypothetical protein